jgi:PPOX class probable F420-dependent enzyme
MTAELTHEVTQRLEFDRYAWLTTVAKSGQPVPRLIWFLFDGKDLIVYSMPDAAKVAHIKARPRVSLNLDSDGDGRGIVVLGGEATIEADADPLTDTGYQAKYGEYAKSMGMTEEFLSAFTARLKISIDRVWTTPADPE